MSDALTENVTIINQRGLHARAAAKLVKCAGTFDAEIEISHGKNKVIATSIMGLMMLAASRGDVIAISAKGRQAQAAIDALRNLISDRFEEDE